MSDLLFSAGELSHCVTAEYVLYLGDETLLTIGAWALEIENSGDGSALWAMNNFAGVFLALSLIAVGIGIITTIVGVVAYKSGLVQQSKFDPWKIVAGLWGAVLLVSMPALIYYGSTLMPAPAATNVQAVQPAYDRIGDSITLTARGDKEAIDTVLGSQAQKYKDLMREAYVLNTNYELTYLPAAGDKLTPDPCYEMTLKGHSFSDDRNPEGKSWQITPDGYSETTCGGPLKKIGG